jgi:two-component system sensor histidine kinase MprB
VSLRARLTVVAAAAVAAAVLLASALVYVAVRSELRGQIDESLRRGGELLARAPLDPDGRPGGDRPGPGFRVLPAAPLEGVRVYAQLITEDGVAAPGRGGQGLIEPSERATAVAAGLEDAFVEDAEAGGTHVRVLTQPVEPGVALQIARSLAEVDDTLGRLRWILAAVSLGGIAAAAALGLVVSRSALRPVARLTAAAERVSETRDLTERIEVDGRDEVARLAASFNAMLAALDASVGAQRQLVTDASTSSAPR